MVKLDFLNALNSLHRRAILEAVASRAPDLYLYWHACAQLIDVWRVWNILRGAVAPIHRFLGGGQNFLWSRENFFLRRHAKSPRSTPLLQAIHVLKCTKA